MKVNKCVTGFPNTCRLGRCPKITTLKPPVAFVCDECGQLEYLEGYETLENNKICGICMDSMTVWETLIFCKCLVIFK